MFGITDSNKRAIYVSISILVITIIALFLIGRIPICECGFIKIWHGDIASAENSQHLFDHYSFTHILHGVLFYLALYLIFPRISFKWRLVMALGVEAGWEILENTPLIIERYREGTISLGYYGDSIVNTLGDIAVAVISFYAAHKLPIWLTILGVVAIELILLYLIRDNLILNIVMLIYPIDAIRVWQMGM